jgi:hypothetical protein
MNGQWLEAVELTAAGARKPPIVPAVRRSLAPRRREDMGDSGDTTNDERLVGPCELNIEEEEEEEEGACRWVVAVRLYDFFTPPLASSARCTGSCGTAESVGEESVGEEGELVWVETLLAWLWLRRMPVIEEMAASVDTGDDDECNVLLAVVAASRDVEAYTCSACTGCLTCVLARACKRRWRTPDFLIG